MLADIAIGYGAEKGVGQGVQHDVGIGMALQGAVVGDLDAAQGDVVAIAKSVDIEAGAGSDFHTT